MVELDPDLRALQEVRDAMKRAKRAMEEIHTYDQAQIDRVCEAMSKAAASAAADLARLAVEETGIGRVHYKILKNLFGAEGVWASIKNEKTVGILSRDEPEGVIEVATPAGIVAGIIPTTNPTSTAIYKVLIAVKAKNAIVISPHPRSRRCIAETVEVMRRAAERVGAPADLAIALSNPTIESTGALMRHRDTALILATGGEGLVTAAYSSGRPAYGVGPGNVPLYVDRSADIKAAARHVTASQGFDNGTLCCSEQALVLDRPIAESFLREMVARGAHICDANETALLAAKCNKNGGMNADVVGQDPWKIAEMSGFSVPRQTTVLLAHQGGVGKDWPLSIEILCPVLSIHIVDGWKDGCRVCMETLHFGGLGHTLGIHATDQAVLDAFFMEKPANRILVNGPTSEGSVGYSTRLMPSMSLGCGPQAGNISSDNITARHMINVKRVAFARRDWPELYARDHARAASLGGEAAPRGSGLPGDPALKAAEPLTRPMAESQPASNWRGNPAMTQGAATARPSSAPSARPSGGGSGGLVSKVAPATKSAPSRPMSFVRPGPSAPRPAAPRPGPPKASPTQKGPAQKAAAVGGALTSTDIEKILTHAGAGCPLGPCKGCPHQEVTTGACTA